VRVMRPIQVDKYRCAGSNGSYAEQRLFRGRHPLILPAAFPSARLSGWRKVMIVDRWEEIRTERPKFEWRFSLFGLLLFMTVAAVLLFLAAR
jgi:hypothetical protein